MFPRIKPIKYRDAVSSAAKRRRDEDSRCKEAKEQRDGGLRIKQHKGRRKEEEEGLRKKKRTKTEKSGSVGRRAMTGTESCTRARAWCSTDTLSIRLELSPSKACFVENKKPWKRNERDFSFSLYPSLSFLFLRCFWFYSFTDGSSGKSYWNLAKYYFLCLFSFWFLGMIWILYLRVTVRVASRCTFVLLFVSIDRDNQRREIRREGIIYSGRSAL